MSGSTAGLTSEGGDLNWEGHQTLVRPLFIIFVVHVTFVVFVLHCETSTGRDTTPRLSVVIFVVFL